MQEKLNKNIEFTKRSKEKLGDSPGFFVGCPEQEVYLEICERNLQKMEETY